MRRLAAVAALILLSINLPGQDAGSSIYAPFVSRLEATVNGSEVVLSWQDSPNDENLIYVILRYSSEISTGNIDKAEQLARVAPGVMVYTDRPDPASRWWYAVTSFRSGHEYDVIIPWRNSLGVPISFEQKTESAVADITSASRQASDSAAPSALRVAPLPVLRIETSPFDGSELAVVDGTLPERKAVSSEVDSALFAILGPMTGSPWQPPDPVILETETAWSDEPLQASLNEIISDYFGMSDWVSAEAALFDLVARNGMDDAVRARVQFYLGQCYYFTERYNESFLSFLTASDVYYPESREWMVQIYSDLLPVGVGFKN